MLSLGLTLGRIVTGFISPYLSPAMEKVRFLPLHPLLTSSVVLRSLSCNVSCLLTIALPSLSVALHPCIPCDLPNP
jgi:hypothetical protein